MKERLRGRGVETGFEEEDEEESEGEEVGGEEGEEQEDGEFRRHAPDWSAMLTHAAFRYRRHVRSAWRSDAGRALDGHA